MATYLPKKRGDILRNALRKIESETGVRTTTVGSVARSFTEAITSEISDFYDVLDYNISQINISSATGRHLDHLGAMYNVARKTISDTVDVGRSTGAFYFYIDSPAVAPIVIPAGTKVYSSSSNFVGRQLAFSTTSDVTIATGETKVFAGLTPDFSPNEITAGVGTLTVTDARADVPVYCTNPKAIHSQRGYESDANYRARIVKRLAVQATGTIEAIRFSLLGVANVREVQIHNNRLGLGVVEVVVIPEEMGFSRSQMGEIRGIIDNVKPTGVRAVITNPQRLAADVNAMLFLNGNTLQTGEADVIVLRCQTLWRSYINNLLPGQSLVYNRLVDLAFDVSDKIVDVTITNFRVAGSSSMRSNYTPQADQIVVPGNLDIVPSLLS